MAVWFLKSVSMNERPSLGFSENQSLLKTNVLTNIRYSPEKYKSDNEQIET